MRIFSRHIYSRYIYQAHFPARPTARETKKERTEEFDEITSREYGAIYRGNETRTMEFLLRVHADDDFTTSGKSDCRFM